MRAIAILAVLGLTVLAYWPSMDAPFVFDDLMSVQHSPQVQGAASTRIWHIRGLSIASLHWNKDFSGSRTFGYHATNLAIHLSSSLVVYGIAGVIVGPEVALVAMAVFALHPLQTESVVYISSRAELLAAFFALLGLYGFLVLRDIEHDAPHYREAGLVKWGFVLICGVIGFLAKETAIVLAVLIVPFAGRRDRVVLSAMLATGMSAAWVAASRSMDWANAGDYYAAQGYVFCRHLGQLFWPVLSLSWEIHPTVLAQISGWLVLAAIAVIAIQYRVTGLQLLILAFVVRSAAPMPDVMVEHRMYLPMLGVALLAGQIVSYFSFQRSLSHGPSLPIAHVSPDTASEVCPR